MGLAHGEAIPDNFLCSEIAFQVIVFRFEEILKRRNFALDFFNVNFTRRVIDFLQAYLSAVKRHLNRDFIDKYLTWRFIH